MDVQSLTHVVALQRDQIANLTKELERVSAALNTYSQCFMIVTSTLEKADKRVRRLESQVSALNGILPNMN